MPLQFGDACAEGRLCKRSKCGFGVISNLTEESFGQIAPPLTLCFNSNLELAFWMTCVLTFHPRWDGYLCLIEFYDVESTQLYSCKHIIVWDLRAGCLACFATGGISRHDAKEKVEMV